MTTRPLPSRRSVGARTSPARSSTRMPRPAASSPRRSRRQGHNGSTPFTPQTKPPKLAWRERALNAEDALKAAHNEIRTQRDRLAELPRPHPRSRTRPACGCRPTARHREHHPQTAETQPHRRSQGLDRPALGSTRQQPVPGDTALRVASRTRRPLATAPSTGQTGHRRQHINAGGRPARPLRGPNLPPHGHRSHSQRHMLSTKAVDLTCRAHCVGQCPYVILCLPRGQQASKEK